MDSNEIKTKILYYFRFKRNYKYIASEVGKFDADVMVSNGKEIIEIEIKLSKNDLKQEFKKRKHNIYSNPTQWFKKFIPNKFYFAIPYYLKDFCFEITENTPYGILGVKKTPLTNRKNQNHVVVVKQAKNLGNFSEKLQKQLINRMGSELIRHKLKLFGDKK